MAMTVGIMLGAMMGDLYGYEVTEWIVVPLAIIFAMMFLYWTRGESKRQ
jgi:predicted MFS family arabinose efflux permease